MLTPLACAAIACVLVSCQALDPASLDTFISSDGDGSVPSAAKGIISLKSDRSVQFTNEGACKKDFSQGTLDLSPLDGSVKPHFKDFSTEKIYALKCNLSYNPCSPLDCGDGIATDSICARCDPPGLHYRMGAQNSSTFEGQPPDSLSLRYFGSDTVVGSLVVSTVRLVCNATVDGFIANVNLTIDASSLTFELHSRYCCLIPRPAGASWSIGDIILLLFFLSIGLYILTVVLFNALVLQRRGVDLLPHRHIWCQLASLSKDGCVFSFKSVRNCICQGRENYSQI